ncbi:MAG: NAD(P)H-binding protein [Chitinophagaceae bacterium]
MQSAIAVIGGTGKAGKYVVEQLVQQQLSFKLLLRNPAAFSLQYPLMEIVQGDACNPDDTYTLLRNCHAVISTLGQPQGQPVIFSQAATNIVNAMNALKIHRYVAVTGLSIDVPGDKKSERVAQLSAYMRQSFPHIIADKQKEYEVLKNSNVDWTLVRVPMIVQTTTSTGVKISEEDCPGDHINAPDLAGFLLQQLADTNYIRKAPFVAS